MEMHIVHGKKSLLYLDDGLAKALTTVDGLSVTGFQFETQVNIYTFKYELLNVFN